MSLLSYDNRTLIGNWQEDRLHGRRPAQQPPHRRVDDSRDTPVQQEQASEGVGQCPPVSESSAAFVRHRPQAERAPLEMSGTAFLHRGIQQQQPQQQPPPTLSPLSLTSHSAYGGAFADSEEKRQLLPASGRAAQSASQRCGGASGERLRVGSAFSPSSLTFVQRCWLPHRQHFDYYLQERVDAWEQSRTRQQQADDSQRRSGSRGRQPEPAEGRAAQQQPMALTARAFIS